MLRLLLVGSVLAVGLVASLWSRFAALSTYVWFALFRPQEWLWTSAVEQLRLSLVVAVALIVPSLLTGIFPNVTHPLSILTIAFLGIVGLAQATTPYYAWSWPWVDAFLRLLLVVLLAVTIINTRRRALLFMAVLAGSLGFHTSRGGLTAILSGGIRFAQGLGGAFTDNNGYALAAAMILPFLWCVSQNLDKTKLIERLASWGFAITVPLTILLVIGTMSRSGFLAVATSLLVYLLLQKRRMVPLLVITAVIAIGLPFVPMPEGYFDRLQTIRTYEETSEASALSRLHFWQVALRMVADNPLGVGLRNFDHAYDRYDFLAGEFGYGRSVHSSHFQALAETGYVGAFLWVSLFVCAIFIALRIRRFGSTSGLAPDEMRFYTTMGNALVVSMTAFLVGGAFIALVNNDLTWYTFGMVAAVDRLARQRRRELEADVPRVSTDIVLPRRRATA